MFYYFFHMISQYAYLSLSLCFYYDPTIMKKMDYIYSIDDVLNKATIYRKKITAKKIILFISGSYRLKYDEYIKKSIGDLTRKKIFEDYDMIVFEKTDKASIAIYEDVVCYINYINSVRPIEELIIVGFSSGGVVSSHIMNQLSEHNFKKKIITYDTPWHVMDNVCAFKTNWLYRLDIVFYNIVHSVYRNHYNLKDIYKYLNTNRMINGANEMLDIITKVHNLTHEKLHEISGFNINQTPETKVINIWCKYDPFVLRRIHEKYIADRERNIKFPIINIEKAVIGHCSDMITNDYLCDLMCAIVM